MTQYLLSVHYVEGQSFEHGGYESAEDMQAAIEAVGKFNQKLQDDGQWVFAGGLATPDTSTVVDATSGETVVTDGPFPEAKEQIAGLWVVEVPDLDAALALASEGSAACRGPVEVRPFQDEPGS